MCKVGGPRCPMDHKRRGEVNARRRTRDRATRAYRSGLVSALEEQGRDDLAQVARKAPSGDLAVMAAATGNAAVGEGLDYVPGLKRANEKVSDDVADALNKIDGVDIDPDNRGASLESMGVAAGANTKDPFVTDTDDEDDVETMQCTTCGSVQDASSMVGTQCYNCANFGDEESAEDEGVFTLLPDKSSGDVEPTRITSRNRRKMGKRADELGVGMYDERLQRLSDEEFAAEYANRDELVSIGAGLNSDFEKHGPKYDSGEWGALATNGVEALDREYERRAALHSQGYNQPDTDEGVYDNIDTPERARAAADAMYAELEHLDRDELAAMDRDELEAMYNKYNAIDDAIRAQGDTSADETSGNAFLNLHDVYHGLDEDGMYPDDDDETSEWVSPEQSQANAQRLVDRLTADENPVYHVIRNESEAYDAAEQMEDDWNEINSLSQDEKDSIPTDVLKELDSIYAFTRWKVEQQGDSDSAEKAATSSRGFRSMYNQRLKDEQSESQAADYFKSVDNYPAINNGEDAECAIHASIEASAKSETSSDTDLAVMMENMNFIGDDVASKVDKERLAEFRDAQKRVSDEVARREHVNERYIAERADHLSAMGRDDFNKAMGNIGLDGNVSLNSDGTVEFDESTTPLAKLKVANMARDYSRYRNSPGQWGAEKFRQTRDSWDGVIHWGDDYGSATVYAEDGDVYDYAYVEGSYVGLTHKRSLVGGDHVLLSRSDDMGDRIKERLEAEFPGHPANRRVGVLINRGNETEGYSFSVQVDGSEQSFTDEPAHYYSALARISDEEFRAIP